MILKLILKIKIKVQLARSSVYYKHEPYYLLALQKICIK